VRAEAGYLIGLFAAAGVAYGADVFVSKSAGTDVPGCGTPAARCRTIQYAITNVANSSDRIVVAPDVYNECVDTQGKALALVAENFLSDPKPTTPTAVLDGTGVCGGTGPVPGPVVLLWDGSSLEGFEVRGGGESGIVAIGSIAITRNRITGNTASNGGGIYLYAVAYPTDTAATVEANRIEGNRANADGGGIYVFAAAADNLVADVRITQNVIRDNEASGSLDPASPGFGGGIRVATTSAFTGEPRVAITQNVIQGNRSLDSDPTDFYLAVGGGIWAGAFGYGFDRIEIRDNQALGNRTDGTGGGISAWSIPGVAANHTVLVSGNTVSANTATEGGGGLELTVDAFDLPSGSGVVALSAEGNEIAGNEGDGFFGGGGVLAFFRAIRAAPGSVDFSVSGNAVRTNRTTTFGGGFSVVACADSSPVFCSGFDDGLRAPSEAKLRFRNNLVSGNLARAVTADAIGGGFSLELDAAGEALAEADIGFATVASNATDDGAGGVDIVGATAFDTAGTNEGMSRLRVGDSIVSSNVGVGLAGGDLSGSTGNLLLDIQYNDVFGNSGGNYDAFVGDRTGTDGNVSKDPLLDSLFVPSLCSPTVDRATPPAGFGCPRVCENDPARACSTDSDCQAVGGSCVLSAPFDDYCLEPEPNGNRANQGHLGATPNAVPTLPDASGDRIVDGVDVLRIATSFASAAPSPRYFAPADLDADGDVDGDDLAYVAAFFGRACP